MAVLLAAVEPAGSATANGKIAFITTRDSGEIYTIDADGTDEVRLTRRGPDGFTPAWSPDGSTIAFSGLGDDGWGRLWLVGRTGDPLRTLRNFGKHPADGGPGFEPDWSPTGARLVFTSYYAIYSARADGSGLRRLTSRRYYDNWDPAWSPAGGAIAFTHNGRIHRMRPDGSRKRLLGPGDEADWSSTGRQIVFSVDRRNGRGDLYVMDADGSDRRRLTNTRADEARPAWSPRGGKIAFQRGPWPGSVWIMDRDGSDQHRIASNAAAPAWSPDGSFLAFTRGGAVFTMRRNGSEVTPLLTPEFDRDVALSPDGAKIAFTSVRPFSQTGVYVADADGTNESFVHSGEAPAWSPDSSQIVLIDTDGLYVAAADGSPTAKLPAPEIGGSALTDLANPRWRPDGGAVSFVAAETGECPEGYTMELDGSDVIQVTATACEPRISEYDWVPGGASIIFAGSSCTPDFECTTRIYSASVPSGTPTELTATAFADDLDPAVSPDGMKIAFTRIDFYSLASWEVWVMDIDGSDEIKLTTSGADRAPAWQTLPD